MQKDVPAPRPSRSGLSVLLGVAVALSGGSVAMATEISIASGRPGGLYYPVAGALCALVNEHTDEHGINCTVAFGAGSVANIEALREGEADMAIAQADVQRDAVTGSGAFAAAGPFTELRSVAALFTEEVTIAARRDKGIVALDDLKGKRVYLGAPGSGGRAIVDRLMAAAGWSPGDVTDVPAGGYTAPDLAEALCDGELDAFVMAVGHPSPLITEAVSMCDVTLVPISGPAVDRLIAENDLYTASAIPAGTYPGIDRAVPGIAVAATLLTTAGTDPDAAYAAARAFVEGYERLGENSPLFPALGLDRIATEGLTAPLHEGAARYYSEARKP